MNVHGDRPHSNERNEFKVVKKMLFSISFISVLYKLSVFGITDFSSYPNSDKLILAVFERMELLIKASMYHINNHCFQVWGSLRQKQL